MGRIRGKEMLEMPTGAQKGKRIKGRIAAGIAMLIGISCAMPGMIVGIAMGKDRILPYLAPGNGTESSIGGLQHGKERDGRSAIPEAMDMKAFMSVAGAGADLLPYMMQQMEAGMPMDEPICLADIHAAASGIVQLRCYHPEVESYVWERYDIQKDRWDPLAAESMRDELSRMVSTVQMTVPSEDEAPCMVRCTYALADGTDITEMASVYPLGRIIRISACDGYTTGPYRWISSHEIPIDVHFSDGKTERIIGLEGLSFIEVDERSDAYVNAAGNMVETHTIISTECRYSHIGTGEKDLRLRYRDSDTVCETSILVSAEDPIPPEIMDVSLSGFEIRNIDEPVTVTVSINAMDNATPSPYLEYAFIPKGIELTEEDWTSDAVSEKTISQNGIWTVHCRDQSGNISTYDKKVVVVDQKPPVMKISLLEEGWCTSNRIIVEARDELPVTYLFRCEETGEESGWTDQNEHAVSHNGTWNVQAKDAVGNVASQEIVVSNIDTQTPVIKGITETKEENDDKE